MSEQTKGFIATNWFKLCIVGFGIALIMIYFSRQSSLDDCLENVARNYDRDWNMQCKAKKLENNCELPRFLAETIEKDRANRSDTCFKRYSFK